MHRLAIHTITTKAWDLPTAAKKYSEKDIQGMGVWRPWLEGRPLDVSRRILDDHGISAASLVRAGFFPHLTAAERQSAIDDTCLAIDEAAAIGAPQLVLVCGANPELSLHDSVRQIEEGIASCLTYAHERDVTLAIEPLHPMYADNRSAITTIGQAIDIIDAIGSDRVGIAADVYHIWWDPALSEQIQRAGTRICGFHVCDWLTPTKDLLNDRGLMGEGCINIKEIRQQVEATGFHGWIEVEIFSDRWWNHDPDQYLEAIIRAYNEHV